MADELFAVREEFRVVNLEGEAVGGPIVLEYLSADDAFDADRDAMVEALARAGLRVERVPCEVCADTGMVRAFQNGREVAHPCPRGCAEEVDVEDMVRGELNAAIRLAVVVRTVNGEEVKS